MFAWLRWMRKGAAVGLVAGATSLAAGCAISTQQEKQLGAQYSAQIEAELPIVDDAAANRYINALGDELAAHGQRQAIQYRFRIVNTDEVNAFAVPGGYVYVNRGLIERTSNLSELAGVMAHEIGHVEQRHTVQLLQREQQANVGLTLAYILLGRQPSPVERQAINVGGALYFSSYTREMEDEADAYAVPLLVESGIDPHGLVTFFRKLLDGEHGSSALRTWFSTHPTTQDRIAHVSALIEQMPASELRGLQTRSKAYRSFKAGLARYPAAPKTH